MLEMLEYLNITPVFDCNFSFYVPAWVTLSSTIVQLYVFLSVHLPILST